jgi:predicted O-methyltransferase YrrM
MFTLEIDFKNMPSAERLDTVRVEEAMTDAARQVMRRKGLPKGRNLVGALDAAQDAAEAELARQLLLERR